MAAITPERVKQLLAREESFERMIPLARRMEQSIAAMIHDYRLPWYVARVGCRVEFRFLAAPPRGITLFCPEIKLNIK
ncbi:MAG: hypothetical protein AB1767_11060 [Bacillota bacterium]